MDLPSSRVKASRRAKKDKTFEKGKKNNDLTYETGCGLEYDEYLKAKKQISGSKNKKACSACGDPGHGNKAHYLCSKNTRNLRNKAIFEGEDINTYVDKKTLQNERKAEVAKTKKANAKPTAKAPKEATSTSTSEDPLPKLKGDTNAKPKAKAPKEDTSADDVPAVVGELDDIEQLDGDVSDGPAGLVELESFVDNLLDSAGCDVESLRSVSDAAFGSSTLLMDDAELVKCSSEAIKTALNATIGTT